MELIPHELILVRQKQDGKVSLNLVSFTGTEGAVQLEFGAGGEH